MATLYIVGAGGFGRELLSWLRQCQEWGRAWEFGGFLDDNLTALAPFPVEKGVVAPISGFAPSSDHVFVCAIGDPQTRLRIGRDLRARGAVFPPVRHPMAVVGDNCVIGAGTILCPGVVVTCNVHLGEFVLLNICSTVGHDARIGDGVTLSPHADVTGFATIGEGAFLGSHATVLPRARVGDYAKVGAGSVVLRAVNAGATVLGVPAKQILP